MFKATSFRQPGDEVGLHRVFNGRPNPRDWAKRAHSNMECGTSRGCSQLGETIAVNGGKKGLELELLSEKIVLGMWMMWIRVVIELMQASLIGNFQQWRLLRDNQTSLYATAFLNFQTACAHTQKLYWIILASRAFHMYPYWFVVWNIFYFCILYWECHHPTWLTNIFQRGRSTTNQIYNTLWYNLT